MGTLLEEMTWKEAEQALGATTIVVIPLGAASKEHGLHLQLRNDFLLAEYFKEQVLQKADVVIAPTINYSYYPAFIEYPGSITLSAETTSKMICEICRSLAAFGPVKFYVLNTGISTLNPLKSAAQDLAAENIQLAYTDLHLALDLPLIAELTEQEGGSHADEIETSMMLQIAPETVNMKLAGKDFQKHATGRLSRDAQANLSYSASGVWGDATLASKDKGEKIVKCLVEYILADIEKFRRGSDGNS